MSSHHHQHHAIYQCLAQLSGPYRFKASIDFVAVGEDIFHCPNDPDSVVTELSERFPRDELLASGIIVNDGNSGTQLNPMLSDGESGFILLRDVYTDEAYDLLTEHGCVTNQLPVLAVLADKQTRAKLAHSESLCVCFSFEDLACLRSLGLAATAGAGMDNMSPEQVEAFCKAFEIELGDFLEDEDDGSSDVDSHGAHLDPFRRNAARPDVGAPVPHGLSALDKRMQLEGPVECQVVLVEWSPASMSLHVPPSAALLRSFLEDVRKHLNLDTWQIQVWTPKPDELERIEFTLKRQAMPWLRRVVTQSLANSVTSLGRSRDSGCKLARVTPQDYVAAMLNLQQSRRGNHASLVSRDYAQSLWRELEEKLDHDFINPMRSSAAASRDPQDKVLRLMFAELSRELLWKLAVSNIKLSNGVEESGIHRGEFAVPDQVKQLAMSVDTMLKVAREIQRCNETTIIKTVVPTAMAVREAPPLQVLASPTRNSNS